MKEPNSKDDGEKLQKHCDLAILIHCEGVQLDSWVCGIDTAHDVVIAARTRQDNHGDCPSVAPSRYVPRLPPGLEISWLSPDRSSLHPLACYSRAPDVEELSVEVTVVDRTQVVICDAPGGIAEHTARLTPITEQYQLLEWIANTIRSTPPVRLQERDVLRENAAQAARVLTTTSEEKRLLDTFLQNLF